MRYIGYYGDGNSHPVWKSLKIVASPLFKRTATLWMTHLSYRVIRRKMLFEKPHLPRKILKEE